MLPELKKDLENSIAGSAATFIDAASRRQSGKVFFRNKELNDFSSLDVLGLSQDKRIKRAAQEAIESSGVGNSGSRKNAGTSASHLLCEKRLSSFFGYERALLFSGRNQAVFSLMASILREQDLVFCDADYAGLLADVCLLLNCSLEVLELDNLLALEDVLSVPVPGRRKIVFADSVSASSGRKLDMLALSSLCLRHQVLLINDESYACGILGLRGAGVADELDLSLSPARPFCVISDLGLGLGCFGACLSGPALLIDALAARSKTLGSEPSFPAHIAEAIVAAIDVCELRFMPRALVKAKIDFLNTSLARAKQPLKRQASSFLSLSFSKWKTAASLSEHLFARGFFCELLPSPLRLSEAAYVRVVPSCWHTDDLLLDLLAAIEEFISKQK